MLDQDYLQQTIRAYMSISLMMNSKILSPKTQRYFRNVSRDLEEEIAGFKNDESSQMEKAA